MNSSFTAWARFAGRDRDASSRPALKADVAIYESTTGLLSNFYGSNAVHVCAGRHQTSPDRVLDRQHHHVRPDSIRRRQLTF